MAFCSNLKISERVGKNGGLMMEYQDLVRDLFKKILKNILSKSIFLSGFWGLINPVWNMCNKGRRQSPINIEPDKLLFDPYLRPLHIDKHKVVSSSMQIGLWNYNKTGVFSSFLLLFRSQECFTILVNHWCFV